MTDQPHEVPETPPLEPTGETVVAGHAAFVLRCRHIAGSVIGEDSTLGTEMLTDSERWGPVWRADYKLAEIDLSPWVNRVVCWIKPDGGFHIGISLGQDIPPLSAA